MSTPTARELIVLVRDRIQAPTVGDSYSARLLAARVEAVLALAEKRHAHEAYDAALRDVLRLLNGGKP